MVVCLRSKAVFFFFFCKKVQIKDQSHFGNFLSPHFPENDCCNYFESCQQIQQEIFPCHNFFNLFLLAIICLFDKISPIFENTYHEN